ncbi:uncharacterized protein LOC110731059 [Chenopodium quinoa]|uniref:uncharacterized protein LOC110731059 n=1 Tax=Chenopodium quinoa TaxID=63459 RepID=UPI000B77766A|nr:uncharacterized protein LOC110731059 [Chenopodium quinoa]
MERYKILVKTRLFYKVKAMAKEKIHGNFRESYSLLPRYAEMIKATNPGSWALITWTEQTTTEVPKFKAYFFSFAAQLRGFLRGCRPIIGIDSNNEIFVIAYRIVDTESCDSWSYFLRNLKSMFQNEGCNRDDWTFISDRMKGVDSAVHETFPRATRIVCCQHLYMNRKAAGFSGTTFHKLFWIAADAYNEYVYNKAMQKILKYNPKAVEYLDTVTEQWSRHTFDPSVRQWCMKRIGVRYEKAAAMGPDDLTEYASRILQSRSDESRLCYATACGGGEFEVRDRHVLYPIKLQTGTCGCGVWQHSGIPCKHVLRVIYHERLQPTDYASAWFKGAAYKQVYGENIHPMPDSTQWQSFNLPEI